MYRYSIFNPKDKLSEENNNQTNSLYHLNEKLRQEKREKQEREEMAKEDKPINISG